MQSIIGVMQKTWKVLWPDGSQTVARSASEVILRTAKGQWPSPDGKPVNHQEMKNQLSKRALALTGKFIHPYQHDDSFLRELHRVGLFDLEVDGRILERRTN